MNEVFENAYMSLSEEKKAALWLVMNELERAETKHPNWPEDLVYAAAIVNEESGELMRAAVQFQMEDGAPLEVKKEAVHTAATALRMIIDLKHIN